jgi:large subunit ribosomal protein L23
MAKSVLIRPVVSEKSTTLGVKENKYAFVVAKSANKITIAKAVEEMYGFRPLSVNTLVVPGKTRVRQRKGGVARGMKAAYKKAYVTLAEGDSIDFFNADDAAQ